MIRVISCFIYCEYLRRKIEPYTFDFIPTFVWIYFNQSQNPTVTRRTVFDFNTSNSHYAIPIVNSIVEYTLYGFGNSSQGKVINEGYGIQWYNSYNAGQQVNTLDEIYYWVAVSFGIVL